MRWPIATTFVEAPPQHSLIPLAGRDKRFVESLSDVEQDVLRARGWSSLVDLWRTETKLELNAIVLGRSDVLASALRAL